MKLAYKFMYSDMYFVLGILQAGLGVFYYNQNPYGFWTWFWILCAVLMTSVGNRRRRDGMGKLEGNQLTINVGPRRIIYDLTQTQRLELSERKAVLVQGDQKGAVLLALLKKDIAQQVYERLAKLPESTEA